MSQLFSPQCLNYIESVFSLSSPIPSPPLSYSFTNLIPVINFKKLQIKKLIQTEDKIIPELHLTFLERFPALSMVNENKYSIKSSENGKLFTSIFILQSICPPFLEYGEYFDTEVLRMLINLLQFSRKLTPQLSYLCNQSFIFLYEKCIKHSQFPSLISNITSYFQRADEYPIEWFSLHILCLNKLLSEILSNPSPQLLLLSSSLVTTIAPRFACFETEWDEQPESLNELYELIFQFSTSFPEKHPTFSQNLNYLDLKQGLIKIGLELNRITEVPFKQYLTIIIQSIQGPLFTEEELNQKVEPVSIIEKSQNNIDNLTLSMLESQQRKDDQEETKLKLDSFSPPKIESIYQFLIEKNHPILKYHEYLFSCLSNLALVSLIKLVITEGQNLILNGNILLQTFLFYELSNLKDLTEIASYVKQKNKKSIFFTETLFNPGITIFNHPESKVHSIRASIYNVFNGMINKSTASFYIPILTDYLNKFIPYPEIFSEFCYFTAPSLCNFNHTPSSQTVILDCLSHAIQHQHEAKIQNLPHHNEIQVLTFVMLDKYIESIQNQNPNDFIVSSFLSEIIFLIFDNSLSDIIFNLIEKYFLIFHSIHDPIKVDTLIAETFPTLDFCLSHIKLCNQQCAKLLSILFHFLGSLQNSVIESLKKTQFFDKIREFVNLEGISVDSLAYALIIEHFAPERHSDSEWKQLAESIEGLEMTETMYNAILILLSHNNEPFTNIGNQNAAFLIPAVLKSQFCLKFLKRSQEILKNSIPDQILFSELGIVQSIISILNEDTSDEIWKSVLDILQLTFVYSTRRNDLLAFFRLFSPIDDHTQTKHMQELLYIIPILVAKEQSKSYRSIIRFTTRNGFIRTPLIPVKRFTSGFTVSYLIMVSNFQKPTDSLRLFKFNYGETFMKAMLYRNRIVISSSLYNNRDISFDISYPLNEWFVLSISFDCHPNEVVVFINDKRIQPSVFIPSYDWPELFDKNNQLFGGEGQGFVECHFKKAAIFNNTTSFPFYDLSMDESLRTSQLTYFYIDSEMSFKGQIQNIAHNSMQNYEFAGQLFQNISPFLTTFYYTKGVSFLISLFSQIDYDIPLPTNSSNEQPYTNSMYFYQLFELISVLIEMSNFVQQKLYEISAFEVIAHFLNNSKKVLMNFDISSMILGIQQAIRNVNLRTYFVRSILLNFPLWTSAHVSTLIQLFKAWRYATKLIPDALSKELRPPVILNVLMTLYETNRVNDEIREILFEILIEALNIDCHSSDLAMIISVMHINQNDPSEIINYLQMLKNLVNKCPAELSSISSALVTTEWITLYNDNNVKSVLINYFMKKDLTIFIQYVLKNIENASQHKETENDSLLLECCCAFTGIKCESINLITQNFSSASLNSINTSIFPILIGYALYASDSTCEQFSKFLLCVFSQKEGVDLIKEDNSKFTLFLLVSFLLLKSQNRIDFMVELVSSNPSIFSSTIRMIDFFMQITLIQYHHVQTNLALRVIRSMFLPSFKCDVNSYIDILFNFVCFHNKFKKKEESQAGEITFHKVLDKFRKKTINLSQYSFNMLKINDKWADFALINQLLNLIPSDKKIEPDRILILLSFLCHPLYFSKETVSPLLNKFVSIINNDSKSWIPVIFQVSRHPKDFEQASDFFNTFKQKVKLTTDLYSNFTKYFEELFTSERFTKDSPLDPPFANDKGDVLNAIRQILTFDSTNEAKTEAAIVELRKNIKDIQHGFESCWNKLHLQLSYQMSPFYNKNNDDHYKQGNYFDHKLRPSIFMRCIPKKGADCKEDVSQTLIINKQERSSNNNNYYDNIYKSENQVSELYHCRCIQIGINKTIGGTFYFTNAGFRFITDSFKVKFISAASITHFFWAASPIESKPSAAKNSIQIFLKNKHCFLFTFPNDDITDLISKGFINRGFMSSIQFFQENEPDLELDRLQLTRKWERLEISNFDYILWLNILSGRSFLNRNAYPIFPNVFAIDDEKPNVVNYSNLKEVNIDDESCAKKSNQMIGRCLKAFEPFKSAINDKDYGLLQIEIPPELYINELFYSEKEDESNDSIAIPKWEKTKVDFIYKMRETLESSNISNQINLWIDKIFGCNNKYDKENTCLPFPLFSTPHPARKFLDKNQLLNIDPITLNGLSNLQIIDFNVTGQNINNASIFILLADGSICKSSIDSRTVEKLDISIPNINRVTSSTKCLFCTRSSHFIVFIFEKKKIVKFNSDPIVSKVIKLAACDEFIAAGGTDGSVVVWSLNPDSQNSPSNQPQPPSSISQFSSSSSNTAGVTMAPNSTQNSPTPSRRKRASTARAFSSVKRASSNNSLPSLDSIDSINSCHSTCSSLESDEDELLIKSEISRMTSSLLTGTSLQQFTSPSPSEVSFVQGSMPCSVLLVHRTSVCSLHVSSLFGCLLSADPTGLIALSRLPDLNLVRTFHVGSSVLKKAIITEGYGAIVALGKRSGGCGSLLTSFSMNGEVICQKEVGSEAEEAAFVVDICGVVGSVSGFDYIAVADSKGEVAMYDARRLEVVRSLWKFEKPIKKIKFSQSLSLLMVFFEPNQDGTPCPPAIISYIMH